MVRPRSPALVGVVPIIPTPFVADESIDFSSLARAVGFAADCGFSGACLPAYASEFYKLSDAEREEVVFSAIAAAKGRLPIVAQANHPSARIAAEVARRYEAAGASLISFAVPRVFPLKEADILAYCRMICRAVSIDVLIQDFNPGGPTVGGDFASALANECPNFRYLKLEEALMGPKIRGIIKATGGRVGVLEGWGGMYLPDLVPSGICGLMPGLGVADILQRVWRLLQADQREPAHRIFERVLPQVLYSLQHSELFLWMEKRLLHKRGIWPEAACHVRHATWTPDRPTLDHGDWLNAQVVEQAKQLAPDA